MISFGCIKWNQLEMLPFRRQIIIRNSIWKYKRGWLLGLMEGKAFRNFVEENIRFTLTERRVDCVRIPDWPEINVQKCFFKMEILSTRMYKMENSLPSNTTVCPYCMARQTSRPCIYQMLEIWNMRIYLLFTKNKHQGGEKGQRNKEGNSNNIFLYYHIFAECN